MTFDTAAPGAVTSARPISGLQPDEQIAGLDVRSAPTTATALYGLGIVRGAGDRARLYRIDPGTGVGTQVGGGAFAVPTTSATAAYGVDFDPASGDLRVVNGAGESLRVDPDDGTLAANDVDLNPGSPNVAAIASAARLLGLGHASSSLVAIDASSGNVTALGPLGLLSASAEALNLDVAPDGVVYATAQPAGGPAGLYVVGASGQLTLAGSTPAALRAFAVLPTTTARFDAAAYVAREASTATIAVVRSGPTTASAQVAYTTVGGTATSGDYASASGTLTFAPGQASRTFDVTIADDALDEDDETIALALRDPAAPLALGSPASATLTIADDELAPPRPDIQLGRLPRTMRLATLLRRGIRVAATPNVPVRLTFALLGRATRAQLSATENLALVTRALRGLSARPRAVRLRPPRVLVGRPRRDLRVRVQVVATDALGRSRAVNRVVRIRVPASRRR